MTDKLTIFSPSGVVLRAAPLRSAVKRLKALGFDARLDESALVKHQRFAGDDATRLAAFVRVADERPSVALAARGGYGITRLLDDIPWKRIAKGVDAGTRWVGYSDVTAFQCALLAHTGRASWAGPLAADDFGREVLDEVTPACFAEAMRGELEAVGFRTEAGRDGLELRGTLWGGNLTVLCALLGTRHWPQVKRGILFIEDVAEHPYRVERMLLQLLQAGVLDAQQAVVVGAINGFKASPLDRGYTLKAALAAVQARTRVPLLTGLPFGHGLDTRVTLPIGRQVALAVSGRDAFIGWGHTH